MDMVTLPEARETDLLWKDWSDFFNEKFKRVDVERPVYGSLTAGEKPVGRIDYIVDVGVKRHLFEAKLEPCANGNAFYGAFKIFAYRAAMAIDERRTVRSYAVGVFLPQSIMRPEYRNILAVSGVEYVTFHLRDDGAWVPFHSSLRNIIRTS